MSFERDIAIVGAGRIGLPWAAVLAADQERSVTCIDIDAERVRAVNAAEAPFKEPKLAAVMEEGVESGRLTATTDPDTITDHEYVAFTVNAPRDDISQYVDTVQFYAEKLTDGQTVISRSTLPVRMVSRTREIVHESTDADINFTTFPERLAEGKAIKEIRSLPKIVGVDDQQGEQALRQLLEPFDCPIRVTDPETALLVKLIDNSYRDALFAISNQIAYTAEQLGLDAHEAIEMANSDYPRNDIPRPGTVGGKCLPKDPHFLTDEWVCEQPTTPDLFNSTRRTNASLQSYIVTELLRKQPDEIAVLGLAYKPNVDDIFNSPARAIQESLVSNGIVTRVYDPQVDGHEESLEAALDGADGAAVMVNHPEFDGIEPTLNEYLATTSFVYDVWGMLDPEKLEISYDGFGIASR